MTQDQIYARLCDIAMLKRTVGNRRGKIPSLQGTGLVQGRAKDGTLIKGVVRGKSKARELMESAEAKRIEEAKRSEAKTKQKRRGRRKNRGS